MAYSFDTTPERSFLMKKIKSTETTAEIMLRKALWHRGLRYRKNYFVLPGKPDIVITKYKIAIFVDGEFWHGYNWHEKQDKIKANRYYWIPKIEKNIRNDLAVNASLKDLGYKVIRFWENDLKRNFDECVERVIMEISAI